MLDDKTVEISSNGKRFARFSLTAIGAISSIMGVIIFCGGWIFGYMTFKADINVITENVVSLHAEAEALRTRLDTVSESIVDDRETLTNQISVLQTDTKYISQGVAELKLANVPKH